MDDLFVDLDGQALGVWGCLGCHDLKRVAAMAKVLGQLSQTDGGNGI